MRIVVVDLQDDSGVANEVGGIFTKADVTVADEVATAVQAASNLGALRVLVNCAGIAPPQRTVNRDGTPHDLELFTRVVAINLVGTFNCIRLAAQAMSQVDPQDHHERGAIVSTASIAAFEGQIGQAAYAASKGGIAAMTLPIARDLASAGIRVNTIAPGIMDTPMLAGFPETVRVSLGDQVLNPARLGRPEEFADLAHLLVTHSYMNGATIRMDGGIRMTPK